MARRARHVVQGAATSLLACVLLLSAGAPVVAAQAPRPGSGAERSARLLLEDFPAVLEPGDEQITVQVHVQAGGAPARQLSEGAGDGGLADAVIEVATHRRTRSRFDFQQAMDAGAVGARLAAATERVDALAPGEGRSLRITRTRAELGLDAGITAGVYPLRVRLLRGEETLAQVTTSIVVTSAERGAPLRTTFLLPFDAPPLLLPSDDQGPPRFDAEAGLQAVGVDGRLSQLLAAAQQPGAFPVTVASSPRLLRELSDIAAGAPAEPGPATAAAADAAERFLTSLRTLVRRPAVDHIALPHGPADLVALVRGGMGLEAERHLSISAPLSEELLDDAPLPGVLWPPDGLDTATMQAAVTPTGYDVLILDEGQLTVSDGRELLVSPSPVRPLRTPSGQRATALVPDPWLTPALDRSTRLGPAVEAQRILAETAALYFERPFAQRDRGLLLAPPQLWAPAAGTAEALLAGMGEAPWLTPVSPLGLVDEVAAELQPVRLGYPAGARDRELPADYVAALEDARGALGALATLLPGGDPVPSRLDRRLLTAAAVHYRPTSQRPQGAALIRSVQAFAAPLFDAVAVNDGLQLILPGTEGTIPVSVSNSATVPLRVTVALGEGALRNLELPGGVAKPVVLPPGSTTTLPFQARVRTPGATFPIEVLVTDVDSRRVLARGQLVVRSTAASPVALVVTAGALLFLLGWWLRTARQRRRPPQEAPPAPKPQPVSR